MGHPENILQEEQTMLNITAFSGRFTADPHLQKTSTGISCVHFRIAVDRDIKKENGQRPTDFISCVAWNQTADFICKYFSKGSMATVLGRLASNRWEEDGNSKYEMVVRTDSIWFGESRAAREERENRLTAPSAPPAPGQEYPEIDDGVPFQFPDGH